MQVELMRQREAKLKRHKGSLGDKTKTGDKGVVMRKK